MGLERFMMTGVIQLHLSCTMGKKIKENKRQARSKAASKNEVGEKKNYCESLISQGFVGLSGSVSSVA